MTPTMHDTPKRLQVSITAIKRINIFWIVVACSVFLTCFLNPLGAEDLSVDSVTVTPSEGAAGDTVTLQVRIANNGPGMANFIQVQWYLSSDELISTEDMALGPLVTLNDYLYSGGSTITSQSITVPAFADPKTPSYFGLMIYYPLFPPYDDDPDNNTGNAAFTFTGEPPHSFYDTVGDNYLDAVHLTAAVSEGNLNVAVTFSQPPSSTVSLLMGIDLDQDPTTTGVNTSLPGTEAMLSLVYQTFYSVVTLENETGRHTLAGAVLNSNTLTYSIPLSLLNNDTAMDLFWAIDHAVGPTADFDRAPDVGVYATDTETVEVRLPGDESIQVVVNDPVEGEFPDIQQLNGRVVGDQLHLTLTYAHSIDVMHLPLNGDGLFVWVDIDRDRRLSTGFANTGQTPPAMGIDHQLRLQIDDLAGIVPELRKDAGDAEPETSPMGLPSNDMFMRLDDNQIILRIPLVYLNNSDGAGALAVTNLNTREILTGTIDRLPDSGAWDLSKDTLLPFQTCLAASREVDDPDDDTPGGFYTDNNELVHASICLGDQALLFAIDYKSYSLTSDGATLIYLDTDHNPDTGSSVTNLTGDTTIGAEYVLCSYWDYNDLKQMTHLYRTVPPESVITFHQSATPTLANRLFLTLPLESISLPAGPVDILVRTASWGGGNGILLPNDDLPDSGVMIVATMPGDFAGDLDADGDVDGADLVTFIQGFGGTGFNASDLKNFATAFGRNDGPN